LYFNWVQWLLRVAFVDEDVILINMDESKIPHEYAAGPGNVLANERRRYQAAGAFFQKVDRSATRNQTTLVAFVCNDAALQPHLPQKLLPCWSDQRKPTQAEQ